MPHKCAGSAEQLFMQAMVHYGKGNYGTASEILQEATAQDPEAPELRFFLGVCYLLTHDTIAGMHELKVAVALGPSPYLEQSHFYLAKAFLQQKDLAHARTELDAIIGLHGPMEKTARQARGDVLSSAGL
jgi:tetratricopeptide (TPR) repeat protein